MSIYAAMETETAFWLETDLKLAWHATANTHPTLQEETTTSLNADKSTGDHLKTSG